jgi:transcription antitermination factor NusA-like protein
MCAWASQLSGWYIDILTEAEESERRQEEFRTRSSRFIEALNIDDVIAHLLGGRRICPARGNCRNTDQ